MMHKSDTELIREIEVQHCASRYNTSLLWRLMKKSLRLPAPYAYDRIVLELIKRGEFKLETKKD